MEKSIIIREAVTENDAAAFWKQLRLYSKQDRFPDSNDRNGKSFPDDSEYRTCAQSMDDSPQDRCWYLFFQQDGRDIGFALPVLYTSEDGKCFVMEYCVYPEYRGNGTDESCASALLDWARENGALYAELSVGGEMQQEHVWESLGFLKNGFDERGEPLMILPPKDEKPFNVEILKDPTDWQLLKLENGFKKEIGEEFLTKENQKQLQRAVKEGKITFFIAKRGSRAVGMCSVAKYYSTFSCSDTGVYEDFYIEPVFRGKGIARKLAQAAQTWCRQNGIASLTVCCAPCDEKMYQALGFDICLGTTFAHTD